MNNSNYEKLKCIWMASHVVDYKLCDNNFDCENCPFDKAMKNMLNKAADNSNVSQNVVDNISRRIKDLKFDDKIVYLKNNMIAKKICEDTYYFGINPVLECFLDSNSSILIDEENNRINKGQRIIDIAGEWGSVSISAPVDLMIYDRIQNVKNNLLRPQWYAIIGDRCHEINNYISNKTEWENSYNKAKAIIEGIKTNEPTIGETMKDGGVMVKFLYQIIGSKKYSEILKHLST